MPLKRRRKEADEIQRISSWELSLRPIPQIIMPLKRQGKEVDMEHFMGEMQLKQFQRRLEEEEKSGRTIEKYSRDLRAFRRYLGESDRVDKATVIRYKENLMNRYAVSSVNSMLAALNRFFKEQGWYDCVVKLVRVQRESFRRQEKELSREEPPSIRLSVQAELAYLLAQQFTDAQSSIRELASEMKTDPQGRELYHFSAMLEYDKKWISKAHGTSFRTDLQEGELLFPSSLRKHRLYLKIHHGQEMGYLSFPDDRLYYILIPLFEQRRVQVRIRMAAKGRAREKSAGCRKLSLWIRLSDRNQSGLPENLNLQIERLLEAYRLS